ncbi:GNAT family N-acetyltransferase [Ornithinibacillus bavariensis]|uniref:N-acetyltransferase n=1 Tax=Ornithinibacillus bavariensis TaxID=545502 RepID=A0A919X7I8_9BACI|nr:GNAT family N-acetyltransferase [Ornithinibacillus bavariensis]GIO25563.1 N-acetyltransferase [Ornithinibacillus bavariensis]
MELTTCRIKENIAIEILTWKYEKPYDFYNNVLSGEAILELMSNSYRAVLHKQEVIGFFCTGRDAQVPKGHEVNAYADSCVDIGIGMKPELTGKGIGTIFLRFILQEVLREAKGNIRLTVAEFNLRAIRLYEKFNFIKQSEFVRDDGVKFIVMVRDEE